MPANSSTTRPDRAVRVVPTASLDPEQLRRLAVVAGSTDAAIALCSPDGVIEWVNDVFVAITGYEADQVVGWLRTDLVHGPFTRSPEFVRLTQDLMAGRETTCEFVNRTASGASYWVSLEVRRVVDDAGCTVGLVCVEHDVTSRRQAEERERQTLRRAQSLTVALRYEKTLLSRVLATIPHSVWWKNADLRYLGANRAYLRMRGIGSEAEVVGRTEAELDGPRTQATGPERDLGARLHALETSVRDSGEPVADHRLALARADGPARSYLVSVLPQTEDGGVVGTIGIAADVSKVSQLERQLAQASRLESIGQLAAGIAHEINTPVQYINDNTRFVADTFGGVLGSLQELQELADVDDPAEPAQARALRVRVGALLRALDLEFVADEVPSALSQSLEGLDRVAQIVRAMKDFAHPGRGLSEADLNRIVETTVQVSRNEWKYAAELDLDLAPDVGVIACFESELKQAVLNVVVNAGQAIADPAAVARRPPGTLGHLTVRTRRGRDEVTIEVTDDGVGMDEAVIRRVFDPFFTTKDVGSGTGQGLAMTHNIVVAKHGGRIDVSSVPGVGSTFVIGLPLHAAVTLAAARGGEEQP